MRIAVIGKSGQLAQSLQYVTAERSSGLIFIGKSEIDIADKVSIGIHLGKIQPGVLINCAAYTAVDNAEDDPEGAELLNITAVENLVEVCAELNIFLIHISTDYVFDGTSNRPYLESAITNPQSVYGKTKLQGEQVLLNSRLKGVVIRTSWLYSPFGKNFYRTIRQKILEQAPLNVVNDQIGVPTSALDLARVIIKIAERHQEITHPELFHVSNFGPATWYEFAIAIRDYLNSTSSINPVSSEYFVSKATRPTYSVLSTKKVERKFGIQLRYWEEALEEVTLLS